MMIESRDETKKDPMIQLVLSTGLVMLRDSEVRDLKSLYGGQFTLSTQFIKPDYLVILPTEAAPQFL